MNVGDEIYIVTVTEGWWGYTHVSVNNGVVLACSDHTVAYTLGWFVRFAERTHCFTDYSLAGAFATSKSLLHSRAKLNLGSR